MRSFTSSAYVAFRKKVKQGIALLDERKPHWALRFNKQNLLKLDINDPFACILATITGKEFTEAWIELTGHFPHDADQFGMHVSSSIQDHVDFVTELWREEIMYRLGMVHTRRTIPLFL